MYDGDSILCSASEDSSVKIWDLRTQNRWLHVANLIGVHDDAIKCCAWSPCGNYIAAGSSDTRVIQFKLHYTTLCSQTMNGIKVSSSLHMHVLTHTHKHTHKHTQTHTHKHTHTQTHTHTLMHVCMHVYITYCLFCSASVTLLMIRELDSQGGSIS